MQSLKILGPQTQIAREWGKSCQSRILVPSKQDSNKTKSERRKFTVDTTDIQRIIQKDYKRLNATKFVI